jgi:N6-adenosine-specific RNA methylase IME4
MQQGDPAPDGPADQVAAATMMSAAALLALPIPAECEAGVVANLTLLAHHAAVVRAALDALAAANGA